MATPTISHSRSSEGLIPIADLWWEAVNQPLPTRARLSSHLQSRYAPFSITPDLPTWPSPNPALQSPFLSSTASSFQQSEPEKIPLLSTQRKQLSSVLAAIVPAAAALIELLLLIYLLDVYLTLPSKDGARQRVSPWYSIWPYISCVGSAVPGAFRAITILYAIFLGATFGVDLIISRKTTHDYWFRVVRFILSIVDGALMVAVAFSSIENWSHTHLYLVSTKGLADISVKIGTYAIDHVQRRRSPLLRRDRAMIISKRWKLGLCFISRDGGIQRLTRIRLLPCKALPEFRGGGR